MLCNDGSQWEPTPAQIDEWSKAFTNCNITNELRQMGVWLNSNPSRRKTRRGMPRFVTSWLSRANQLGGSPTTAVPIPKLYVHTESRECPEEVAKAWMWYIGTHLSKGLTEGVFKSHRDVDEETQDRYLEIVNEEAARCQQPHAVLDEHKIESFWNKY